MCHLSVLLYIALLIYIESLPAIIVASHRAVILSYDELGKLYYMTIGSEMCRLGCECPELGYCYAIEHGGSRLTVF